MSTCKVHNVRFYKPKPKAVYCMALSPQVKEIKLALSRSDASIEIWNLTNIAFIEKSIASSSENFSIEGLAWCGDNRLFSVGLHGLIVEYDLLKLCVKNRATVTGEAAFCIDVFSPREEVAIGTEQGYLNIFNVCGDEIIFEKFLDKQEGRILCLKYSDNGACIVTGSMDAIRVWNVETGHALHKMSLGRSEKNKPTIVWCLAVTQDFTIISGDSRGKLTFWDGNIGAQLESYQSHRADILSLCISQDENTLYCAGIDPNITSYVRITIKDGAQKWVKSIQRKIHDHDIRALALNGSKLYSSGVDGYLACSYHPPKTLLKFPPILQNPCITLCNKSRFIMLRYPKFIEIWSLAQTGNTKDKQTGLLTLEVAPKKLVVLQKVVKTDDGEDKKEGIICATISNDGAHVFYSTRHGFRVFKLAVQTDSAELVPIEIPEEFAKTPCVGAIFTDKHLIVAPNSGNLNVFKVENSVLVHCALINCTEIKNTITFLSSCENYLVVGDCDSSICIWVLKQSQYVYHCQLPKYRAAPTALAIHPKLLTLVVAYADCHLIEYDMKNRELTAFSRSLSKSSKPKQWTSRTYPIRNVTFDPRVENIIILHDDNSIIVIDKEKEIPDTNSKIPKIDSIQLSLDVSKGAKALQSHAFHSIKKYKHLVHLSWLSDDEMVAVEVNPLCLVEQLPPCLVQNTFGRK